MIAHPAHDSATLQGRWDDADQAEGLDDGDARDVIPMSLSKRQLRAYRHRLVERNPECVYCGRRLAADEATLEHFIPQSKGGGHHPWNLFLACSRCNQDRGNRDLEEWAGELRRSAAAMLLQAHRVDVARRRMSGGVGIETAPETPLSGEMLTAPADG